MRFALDQQGTVLAAIHYDLNFMTIHGKSRFPGLYVWSRTGKKMAVRIPDGCLLVQVIVCFRLIRSDSLKKNIIFHMLNQLKFEYDWSVHDL